jgi:hypothetical protein
MELGLEYIGAGGLRVYRVSAHTSRSARSDLQRLSHMPTGWHRISHHDIFPLEKLFMTQENQRQTVRTVTLVNY